MVSEETKKFSDDLIITNLRQKKILEGVLRCLKKAHHIILANQGYEYASIDLQEALDMMGEITGETTTDEILNGIFSSFCIGK
jgi:tRNA modification GTPase